MRRGLPLAALVICACGAHAARPTPTPTAAPPPVATTAAAERGADLFTSRGCAACHTIGEGLRVGPDLAGLAERREADWVRAMITRPDSMIRHDPVARDLAADYRTAMPRLGIGPDEADALLAYLRTGDPVPEGRPGAPWCPCPGCGHGRHAGRAARAGR